MSGTPRMIAAGAISTLIQPPMEPPARDGPSVNSPDVDPSTSEWEARAQRYAAEAVASAERGHRRRIEQRLDKPSRHWASPGFVRTYDAGADGERRFREEADVLRLHGFVGWLETEPPGHPLGARLLVAAGLGALAGRDSRGRPRKRTLTWVRQGAPDGLPARNHAGDARTLPR
jgi:hypothetical protein